MKDHIHLRYLIFLGCTGALGGLLFGFDIAIITGAGPFITRAFGLSDLGLGWAFSSLLFGCIFGSLLAGRLTDRFGRRSLLIAVALLFALTSAATAAAHTFTAFIAARFLGGIAVGAVSLLSPIYVAEVSAPSVRGRMGTLYQLSIVLGVTASFGINYLLRDAGANNWRWMFSSGIVPSLVFAVLISLAPETPRFLVMRGRVREASALLERIASGTDGDGQVAEIKASMRMEKQSWRDLLRPGVRRALIVSAALAVLVQVSGINTIIDYAPAVFQSAGSGTDSALAATCAVGLIEFLFVLVSLWAIDRYGRKPLYIIGSLGMALSLLVLVIAVVAGRFHGAVVLALILTYLAFFSFGVGPVFWTLVPEIFPNDVRGRAMIVPVLVQWVANAVVVLLFPFAFHIIGRALTLGFLALMALTQGVFTWLFVPETRNKRLEEIENYWIAHRPSASRVLQSAASNEGRSTTAEGDAYQSVE
jgi:MFS transporter, SP family, arabinose:H+ symporter